MAVDTAVACAAQSVHLDFDQEVLGEHWLASLSTGVVTVAIQTDFAEHAEAPRLALVAAAATQIQHMSVEVPRVVVGRAHLSSAVGLVHSAVVEVRLPVEELAGLIQVEVQEVVVLQVAEID